jgi:uncharacterized protein YybS (DUF2232 family)
VKLLKAGWKSLAWSLAALVLLLSVPMLGGITLFFIMTPIVVLFASLRPLAFIAHILIIGLAAFAILGGYGAIALMLAFFFLVPSIAMGFMYKRKALARNALLIGFAFILAQLLVEFAILSFEYKFDLAGEISKLLTESFKKVDTNGVLTASWIADTSTLIGQTFATMLPSILILLSFLFAIITHGLSRWGLRTVGIDAPSLPQARTWRLPRSLVLYFLIAEIASFAMSPNGHSYWYVAVANLIVLLQYAFIAQGIGFFGFLGDAKKWSKPVTVLLSIGYVVLAMIIAPLFLIGLIDAAFPLRRYFVKS